MTKILIATPIQRRPDGSPFSFPRAMQTIHGLRFKGQIDYFQPSAVDTTPANLSINSKYQQAQELCMSGGYDALFCAESDMLMQPDTLERLWEIETDVTYGLYVFRHGKKTWSAYTDLTVSKGVSISSQPEKARKWFGKPLQVKGIGLGCTLIRRHVFDAVDLNARADGYTDWLFAQNVDYAGGEQICHMGVTCGHIHKDTVLWPDPNEADLIRVEAL